MTDDRRMDESRPDQNDPSGGETATPMREPRVEGGQTGADDGGTDDAGQAGEDRDILGKDQADLDADDLSGDAREAGVE